jgi:hypothetical protein
MNPEEKARQQIDDSLHACGWAVQDYKALNLSESRGVALREVPLKSGRCDYLLLVDRKAVGVVEAKKEGTLLSNAADQSAFYATTCRSYFRRRAACRLAMKAPASKPSFATSAIRIRARGACLRFTGPKRWRSGVKKAKRCAIAWRKCRSRIPS